MDKISDYMPPLGRLLLCSLFVWAGYGKLMDPGGAAQYLASSGVPAPALTVWVAILIELVGGLALLVGFKSRWSPESSPSGASSQELPFTSWPAGIRLIQQSPMTT